MRPLKRLHLPKIYPVTDRQMTGMSHTEQVRRLIEGGATLIQIREKTLQAAEWLEDGRAAILLAKEFAVKIIINDRVDMAMVLRADGVHLGQTDLPPEAARRLLGDDAIIGYSTQTIEEAERAAGMPVDYIALGPIFPTQIKSEKAAVGLHLLAEVRRRIGRIPLVAIGGIGESTICEVFSAGADSAAMIGALLDDPIAISERMSKLLALNC